MVKKFGPSRKQSTGQTSTQSVYLHLIQASVTVWVMLVIDEWVETRYFIGFQRPYFGRFLLLTDGKAALPGKQGGESAGIALIEG
jgi:hypothetical protein